MTLTTMNVKTVQIKIVTLVIILGVVGCVVRAEAKGPVKETNTPCARYALPASLLEKPFHFADEVIPLQRKDVGSRILSQINFLLLDARSVLTLWLTEKQRRSWIYEEVFAKQHVPKDFALFAPVIGGLGPSPFRKAGVGGWSLEKPCDSASGVEMASDKWHEDRMDVELSTRCFAVTIKSIRKDLGTRSWLMAAAAYATSTKSVQDIMKQWNTTSYWDLPLPEEAEKTVVRWIALGIIKSHQEEYGLKFRSPAPYTYDQVTGLTLVKDLPLAEIARMTGVPSRVILELNPKVRPSVGVFPAQADGKTPVHTITAPKGKGDLLVEQLKKAGYLGTGSKR